MKIVIFIVAILLIIYLSFRVLFNWIKYSREKVQINQGKWMILDVLFCLIIIGFIIAGIVFFNLP